MLLEGDHALTDQPAAVSAELGSDGQARALFERLIGAADDLEASPELAAG